jgi:hypothetical protein
MHLHFDQIFQRVVKCQDDIGLLQLQSCRWFLNPHCDVILIVNSIPISINRQRLKARWCHLILDIIPNRLERCIIQLDLVLSIRENCLDIKFARVFDPRLLNKQLVFDP